MGRTFTKKGRVCTQALERDRIYLRNFGQHIAALVETRLSTNCHGWRKGHSVATAVSDIESRAGKRVTCDIRHYFPDIDQARLRKMVNKLDAALWSDIAPWLPETGLLTGCAVSSPLANLYLSDIDRRFPLVRYADNFLVTADDTGPVLHKLQRHLADIGLEMHEVEEDPARFCGTPLSPQCRGASSKSSSVGIAPTE